MATAKPKPKFLGTQTDTKCRKHGVDMVLDANNVYRCPVNGCVHFLETDLTPGKTVADILAGK